VGGVPEVIIERQTGMLVPVDQPDALAACVRELRRDDGLRKRLRETGPTCVRSRFHQTVVIARLEALYQSLARINGK